ncbi:ribosomal RNA-processing protein 8 [Prorops nasuta]|uniref:ribosomal RNA-processing protein 8 n=1 Tax=Prorops nasuta TaxID=863751 RepID=UPI0034CDD83E
MSYNQYKIKTQITTSGIQKPMPFCHKQVKLNKKSIKFNNKMNTEKIKRMLIEKAKNKCDKPSILEIKPSNKISLREKMMQRLNSSRFRFINEQLYSFDSSQSKRFFAENPDEFLIYHEGYKRQVAKWPLNPLERVASSINHLSKDFIIADFGCGEGKLADSVVQKVHSFDLVAINSSIIACDIAHTPLLTGSIDVVVFCLSLMGTNLGDYIREANRVLKKHGLLKIAEVESRFDDVSNFIISLNEYGFKNIWKDLSHNTFYFMDFKKDFDINKNKNRLPIIALKPCLYKKR